MSQFIFVFIAWFRSMLSIAGKMTSTLLTVSQSFNMSQFICLFISCFQIHAECCREDDEYLAHSLTVSQHEPIYISVYLTLSDPCWVLSQRWRVPCSQSLTVIQHEPIYIRVYLMFSDPCWVLPWRWRVPCSQSHSKSTWANLYSCLSHVFRSMLSLAMKMTSTLLTVSQ